MPTQCVSLLSLADEQDQERQKDREKDGQIEYRFHAGILGLYITLEW
jgi:hypothetical protein